MRRGAIGNQFGCSPEEESRQGITESVQRCKGTEGVEKRSRTIFGVCFSGMYRLKWSLNPQPQSPRLRQPARRSAIRPGMQ